MPSKLLTVLANGKDFIASSTEESELGKIASRVGLRVYPEYFYWFKKGFKKLVEDKYLRNKLGKRDRNYAIKIMKNLKYYLITWKDDRWYQKIKCKKHK